MLLPEGLRPMNSPLCVPRMEFRTATRSPSATIAEIGSVKSGNAERSAAKYFLRISRPGQTPGREILKKYFAALRSAFPDLTLPISAIVAEGDRVAVLNSIRGTHKGEFIGLKPSGRSIDAMAFQLYRIENGQLAEHWEVADFALLMRQLQG